MGIVKREIFVLSSAVMFPDFIVAWFDAFILNFLFYLFFFLYFSGVRLSPLGTAATTGLF
jgi:hypothetical protein